MPQHDDSLREMRESVMGLPDQLRGGLALKASPALEGIAPRSVLLVGMGGSAIGADMLLEWLRGRLEVPASVLRDGRVPGWVREDTLVVAVSYSGNTRETLEAAEATGKGRLVAVTTGGRLAELCADGHPLVSVPPTGMPPRTALGYLFSAAVRLMEDAGILAASGEVEEAAEDLEGNMPAMSGTAARLAGELDGTLPTVYGYAPYVSVARRWATQLNENAKMVAWSGELPEAAHNQVEGWGGGGGALSAVFLREPREDEGTARLVDEFMKVVSRQAKCRQVIVKGGSVLSRMFGGVVVGDLLSLELASRRGVDPKGVPIIEGLKRAVRGG